MKSFDGCWTCRLRKKRCDESRPACSNCSSLQITCHFGDEKPAWMDGGAEQRAKADEIKHELRHAAARRRGILPIEVLAPLRAEPILESHCDRTSTPTAPSTTLAPSDYDLMSAEKPEQCSAISSSDGQSRESGLDRRFMMFYFDHFFPFLFPFYKPSLLEGGRSWIMELILGDRAMWHTTLCLSTYFVSITLDGAISGPNVCKDLAWGRLLEQMRVTFVMLQNDIREVASSGTQDVIVKTSRIMGSIIQLQRFETTVGNFDNCQKHLSAAIALYRQVLQATSNIIGRDGRPAFRDILSHMGQRLWATTFEQGGAWNSDQAAFRFYSALLIVDDIIASTCTGTPPRLQEYHTELLTNDHRSDERPPLNLEDFVGCESWVLLRIGEISALDAWKWSTQKAGKLDMMELVARASTIKQALLADLARLDASTHTPETNLLGLYAVYNDHLPPMPGGCAKFVTRVWAQAALLYLSLSVSGWQPGSVGIRENVVRTLTLLEQMPAAALLRTMVWPFCIAGCLAEPGEECRFRALADALMPHRLFAAARKALEIMEHVWRCRNELTVDSDFAACMRRSGYTESSMPILI
ncbi:fungal-specific transcription factor domain-containing protein [Neohortaea acidophila]|uniref:Fungal-specific transcription factor domain-containing protein n=1 Tax=Neohortaea acidophila TaxID=245834 RepID=A0A6A6PFL9_9PEZI|nr:fungal-specific transcription factor domain-containing protein [Neohortaea acidophila]KAF2478745.1 fungal-specific transcription factor domain-containing protein [Neohortaea acidophila]